ncbi:aspartic peptidase domain-containing protein [Mycena capillaripes]|nr:aspartic peptidase domain-containing protein [Mycena capillaripes]
MPQICPLLVTLLGLLYFAAALAIEEKPTPRSFSLPASCASERYQAGKRSITGSVSGTHAHGDILVDITFGSQNLPILFDTASSNLWVWSTYYTGCLSGNHYYDISASTTWTQIPEYTYSVTYVNGLSSSGVVGTDKVSLAGIPFTAYAWYFPPATNIYKPPTPTINENTFMQNIASSLPAPIFAVYLPWRSGAAASSIDFGYIDSSKYTGTLSTVPLISGTTKWAFTSTSSYVNGVHHSVTFKANRNALIGMALISTFLLIITLLVTGRYHS